MNNTTPDASAAAGSTLAAGSPARGKHTRAMNFIMTDQRTKKARREKQLDAMAEAFLRWPLPESVCADLCATKQGPGRIGTNLLTFAEARQMFEHVLANTGADRRGV